MKLGTVIVLVLAVHCIHFGGNAVAAQTQRTTVVGGGCEDCELIFAGMPMNLSWETAIAESSEVGEPLETSGTIYQQDGKTPAQSVILYWIDEYVFADDEFLTEAERQQRENRGGAGIVTLAKNAAGVWVGHREIVLGPNVPNDPSE